MNRNEKEVLNAYHDWLVLQVDPYYDFATNYSDLMWALDTTEYVPNCVMNESREADGVEIRCTFDDISGLKMSVENILSGKKPTLLEVLVALFTRYSDFVLFEPGQKSVAPELFFDCLAHLGLLNLHDFEKSGENLHRILADFMAGKLMLFDVPEDLLSPKTKDLWLICGKYAMLKWF